MKMQARQGLQAVLFCRMVNEEARMLRSNECESTNAFGECLRRFDYIVGIT
jgi:hypothetical protein